MLRLIVWRVIVWTVESDCVDCGLWRLIVGRVNGYQQKLLHNGTQRNVY